MNTLESVRARVLKISRETAGEALSKQLESIGLIALDTQAALGAAVLSGVMPLGGLIVAPIDEAVQQSKKALDALDTLPALDSLILNHYEDKQ